MKQHTSLRPALFASLMLLAMFSGPASAQSSRKGELYGEWLVRTEFNGRQMESILSFPRGREENLTGQWISFMGISELKDLRYEDGQLSFARVSPGRDGQSSMSTFKGTVQKAVLSGVLSGERGEFRVEGRRIRPIPPAVGEWETKVTVNGQEYTATLVIKAGEKGRLTAAWQSQWGEHEIADVAFKTGKLTFTRRSKVQDRQWTSAFEGTVKGQTLSGAFTSDEGRVPVQGKRVGGAIVGTWDLKITSDSGNRTQRLRVHPDLSGRYGPLPIDKVKLEGNRVSFTTAAEFGDQKFDISLAGTLDGGTLRGELTSPRGSRTVEGLKRGAKQTQKPTRKPDVIFVPTPQEAVEKMLELAQVRKDDLLYDLGCGDGRIVVTAAKTYGCRAIGYDISPVRVRESRDNVEKNGVGDLVSIEQRDIFTLDLSKANVITLYLLPSLNVKLIPQLEKLKPGSRIVSHDFDMKGVTPDQVVTLGSNDSYGEHTIYLWTTPLKKE